MTGMAEYVITERDNDGNTWYLMQFETPATTVGAGPPGTQIHMTRDVESAWKFAEKSEAEKEVGKLAVENPGRKLVVEELGTG